MNDDGYLWMCLPDTILLHIFTFLSLGELLRAAETCRIWFRMSRAEVLWKRLLYKEWKIDRSIGLPPGCTSFFREFRRLRRNVPCVEVQVLREHTDQVLHVSFAHNGKLFATCSRDGSIKVWRVASPVSLKYHCGMKELLRWQCTQFSQFNANDTLLLVSGVHFGPQSISGEIAVFNLKDKFALQARVQNKPFDVFGCWLNNAYLLSGNLHFLGSATSCSALWLNKATQEVLSEQESVIMRLFKFLNLNASHVRSIIVANCRNLGKGEIDAKEKSSSHEAYASSSCAKLSSSGPVLDSINLVPDSSESELDSRAGLSSSYLYESDAEMTASESDVGQIGKGLEAGQGSSRETGQGSNEESDNSLTSNTVLTVSNSELFWNKNGSDPRVTSNSDDQTRKTLAIRNSTQESQKLTVASHVQSSENDLKDSACLLAQSQDSRQSQTQEVTPRSSPAKRDMSDARTEALRKSLRVEQCRNDCEPNTSGTNGNGMSLPHVRTPNGANTCYERLWQRVQKAELRRGGANYDEDLFRILIDGVDSNHCANYRSDLGTSEGSSDKIESASPSVSSSCCSSRNTVQSSLSHPDSNPSSPAVAAESTSRNRFTHVNSEYHGLNSRDSLDNEPSFDDHQVLPLTKPDLPRNTSKANSRRGNDRDDPTSTSSGSTSDTQTEDYAPRAKIRRKKSPLKEDQYLIFTQGTQTYIPHQIGIKRIDSTMANTLRGPLGVSKQPSEPQGEGGGAEGSDEQGGLEFDSVDHVIELNGRAIGMALSPDHRYLYVNCRCWPKDCVISDPLVPPPIAREIEIRTIDLVNMTEVKRFYGHTAFTPNDELNFIFLDVCDNYVASGSENRHAFIWDRHYGVLLARLPHRDVVNSVAFNPRDPEMMVTTSDDYTIKIWFSRHKAMTAGVMR